MTPAAVALLGLATLAAALDALMKTAAIVGIATKELSRPQGWRTVAGAATAKAIAFALLILPLEELLGPAINPDVLPAAHWLGVLGAALLSAILIATVFFSIFLLLDRFSRPASKIVPAGARVADVFGFWAVRKRERSSGLASDEPEFEITMASGEEVEEEEREMIENILELGDTTVREVMKPRPDVLALDANWPADRIVAEVAGSRHSRFPVYEDTVDNISGVLHLRDLFEFLARSDGLEGFDLRSIVKEPHFIPESKKVDDALREMQRVKGHMAVVLDEYGGTAGIVTIEDMLEEIVGEIQDEYDDEARQVHQREDGSYVVTANLPLDDLCELLDVHLEAEDVDTVGGFVVNALGRIPEPSDVLELEGLRFTVLSVERKRIGRVKVERLEAA
jgi:CBS domain containing-hemolysin-like protein